MNSTKLTCLTATVAADLKHEDKTRKSTRISNCSASLCKHEAAQG